MIRKIDDLGRVVIPKEIRKTLRIREGELSIMIYIKVMSSSKIYELDTSTKL